MGFNSGFKGLRKVGCVRHRVHTQEIKNAYTVSFAREHYEDLGVDGTVMRS